MIIANRTSSQIRSQEKTTYQSGVSFILFTDCLTQILHLLYSSTMNTEEMPKSTMDFLKKNFSQFKLIKKLGHFSPTYLILANGEEYIVKTINRTTFGSIINHDKRHVEQLVATSSIINKSKDIKTISIISYFLSDKYSILLFKKDDISEVVLRTTSEFKKFGAAIHSFHTASSSARLQKLPWNNFPEDYITELKNNNRWLTVKKFLSDYEDYIGSENNVSCHSDIHAGNIFFSDSKIIFLDIDDMCHDSYFNDLGMVIANFTDSNYSKKQLREAIESLVTGYCKEYIESDIIDIAIYALRKLYFTEGYYLYFRKITNEPVEFINELTRRQNLLIDFLSDYKLNIGSKI